jgi:hypothetical protein
MREKLLMYSANRGDDPDYVHYSRKRPEMRGYRASLTSTNSRTAHANKPKLPKSKRVAPFPRQLVRQMHRKGVVSIAFNELEGCRATDLGSFNPTAYP